MRLSILSLAVASLAAAPLTAQSLTLLDQPPTGTFGLYSEVLPITQSNSEDFMVTDPNGVVLEKITWWGVTDPSGTPGTDAFEILIHDDMPGSFPNPAHAAGTVLHSWNAVVPVRTATGANQSSYSGSLPEYMYEVTLATPVVLPAGHYHVQIYNDTSSSLDNFVWGCGTLDAVNGVTGFNWAAQTPGVNWNNSLVPANGMSLRLEGSNVPSGPQIAVVGTCGQPGSGVTASGLTPNGLVGLAWGLTPGSFVIGGAACVGTSVGVLNPRPIAVVSANANGDALIAPGNGIPAGGCAVVYVQALDISSCAPSNLLAI